MRKLFIIIVLFSYVWLMSCSSAPNKENTQSKDNTEQTSDNHAGHDHDIDDHTGHDHGTETDDHAGHDHGTEVDDHAGHDHGTEVDDHAGHDHGTEVDDHAGHDHGTEVDDHTGHDHGTEVDDHAGHDHGAEDEDEHLHGESNNEDALKDYIAKRLIKTLKLYPQDYKEVIRTSGKVMAAADQLQNIVASVNGTINYEISNFTTGYSISKGNKIFSITPKGLESNTALKYATARKNLDLAKSKSERAQNLLADKIISQREYDEIKSEFDIAKATFKSYKNFSNGLERVFSPLNGTIDQIMVQPGEYVEAGQILAMVRDNNKVQIKADLGTKYASKLSQMNTATFKTTAGDIFDIKDFNGFRTNNGNIAIENNFLPLYFTMDQPDNLILGDYLEVYLYGDVISESILIPNESILEEQGQYFVFVRHGPADFDKVYITKGGNDGEFTQVLSGLKAGNIIVTKGATIVKLATQTTNMPASTHSH